MPKFIVDSVVDGLVTLAVPGTNYENTFKLGAGKVAAGDRVRGTIHAPAWKAETVSDGGNYVEPLLGRPRRMQGTVIASNAGSNELTVHVGYDVIVKLPDKYRTYQFPVGTRVGWDNIEMPTFEAEPAGV
jgi:hypothetical protein